MGTVIQQGSSRAAELAGNGGAWLTTLREASQHVYGDAPSVDLGTVRGVVRGKGANRKSIPVEGELVLT